MSAAFRQRDPNGLSVRDVALNAIQARMVDGRPFTAGEVRDLATEACGCGATAYRATVTAINRAKRSGDIRLSGFGASAVWRLSEQNHNPAEQERRRKT